MTNPTKLTPDTKKRIIQAIKQGATYELASQYGGITYRTFNNWMNEGETAPEGSELFLFFHAIKKAEGEAVVGWLKRIEAASRESWQAAAWKLERRYPKDYGRQVQEHAGPDGQPLQFSEIVVNVKSVAD